MRPNTLCKKWLPSRKTTIDERNGQLDSLRAHAVTGVLIHRAWPTCILDFVNLGHVGVSIPLALIILGVVSLVNDRLWLSYVVNETVVALAFWKLLGVARQPLLDKGPVLFLIVASMTVAMAALSWKFLEQPFNGLKRHFPYEPDVSSGPQEVLTQSN